MKHALFNPIATRKEWRISAIALAFVLLAMFGLSSGVAQVKNQKRVTSVRLGSASAGSRVTVVSDSALNDYEAYRRGDRFYVKIPAADFASAVPNFRGTGFEDVQVQKAADSAVISFRLQPGTTARVDQRSNRLDVVFSTSGRSQNAGGNVGQPAASPGSSRDGRDSTYSSQKRNDRPAGESISRPQQAVAGSQNASSGSASLADVPASSSGSSATAAGPPSEATSTPESLLSPAPQSRASDTSQRSATQTVPPHGGSVGQWVVRNWLVVLIAALLLASLAFLLVIYRRSTRNKTNQAKRAKQTLVRPKSAVTLNEHDFAVPVVQPAKSSVTMAEDREQAGFTVEPVPSVPLSSETNRIQKKLETPSSKSVLHSREAKPLIAEKPLSNTAVPFERIDHEVTKLLAGEKYDTSVINAADSATRQMIAAQLLTALGDRSFEHHEHARQAFLNHGYFDEATRDLRAADSPAERAAAASRLGRVGNSLGTTHLIAALHDDAPEVRRSAVESLGQIGDPAALSALNDLLLCETSRQVPKAVIRHAINSITVAAARPTENLAPRGPESQYDTPVFQAYEREAFHEFMGSKETKATEITNVASPPSPSTTTPPPATMEGGFAAEETQLRLQEEALIRAAEELERRRLDAEGVRKKAEEEAQLKAANEERARANAEAQLRAEEEARRAEQEARQQAEEARLRAEEEARLRAEHELRERSEEEARLRAEEDARFRLEAETLRRAAEELARRRAEAEAARRLVEEETQRRAEEARERVAEETRRRAEEEAQRQVQEELRRRVEEEMRRRIEERRVEEEARRLADEEARRRADEERQQLEAEERRRVTEERLQMEQEALMQAAAELTRRRAEVEEARRRAEEETRLLLQAQEQMRAADEQRRLIEEERQRLEAEARRRLEEERQRLEAARRRAEEEQKCFEEARLRAEEEQKRFEEQARLRAEEEKQRLAELDVVRKQAEQRAYQRAEQEQRIRAEIEVLRQAEQEQHERIEAATRRRAEVEARLREEEARRQAEEEARLRVEQEVRQQAEEARLRAEEEVPFKAEAEARLREEEARRQAEEAARLQGEYEARHSAEEARLRAEEEASRRMEAEARLREEEASRQAEEEARLQAERKSHRIAEEARLWAEQETQRALASESIPGKPDSQSSSVEVQWTAVPMDQQEVAHSSLADESLASSPIPDETTASSRQVQESVKGITLVHEEKGLAQVADDSSIPSDIFKRLNSNDSLERAAALAELAPMGGDDAFSLISRAFDDESADVRNAAAHALYEMQSDRAASFTRALREGSPERRRKIGAVLATSGLANNAISNLTGESREKTYDAFSLLFLMAKAGEVQPLMQAIEEHANVEVRLAVVKLLALSGQAEIVPAFRRLAVRGSLPSEVRSAVMEAIYQISSQTRESAHSAA